MSHPQNITLNSRYYDVIFAFDVRELDFFLYDLTVRHFDNTTALFCDFWIVSNDNDCFSLFVKAFEKLHYLGLGLCVQRSCRLVSKYHGRLVDNCSGYSNTLLLSSRKLVARLLRKIPHTNSF